MKWRLLLIHVKMLIIFLVFLKSVILQRGEHTETPPAQEPKANARRLFIIKELRKEKKPRLTLLVSALQFKTCRAMQTYRQAPLSTGSIYRQRLRSLIGAVCESEQAGSGSQ